MVIDPYFDYNFLYDSYKCANISVHFFLNSHIICGFHISYYIKSFVWKLFKKFPLFFDCADSVAIMNVIGRNKEVYTMKNVCDKDVYVLLKTYCKFFAYYGMYDRL